MLSGHPIDRAALSDALVRLGGGDRAALDIVYDATRAKLFGICYRILGDRERAEDALHDLYVGLVHSAHRYDPDRASPISWLAVLARNRAIDRLRMRKVDAGAVPVEAARHVPDAAVPADRSMEARQDAARIHRCLEELEDATRDAIRASFLEGSTYAALADRHEVPLGTMKSRIRRGLARLKGCMER